MEKDKIIGHFTFNKNAYQVGKDQDFKSTSVKDGRGTYRLSF